MRYPFVLVMAVCVLLPRLTAAQGLTGTLIGTVKDAQGGVLPGAVVRVSSSALVGGLDTVTTSEKGQLRFQALPPGSYTLHITMQGFAAYHEDNLRIGAAATVERNAVLRLAGLVRRHASHPCLGAPERFPLDSCAASGWSNGHSDLWYDHLCGATSGTRTLSAPTQPGQYEFRFMIGDTAAARSNPVTVSASASPLVLAVRARER